MHTDMINIHRFSLDETIDSSSSMLSAMWKPVVSMETRKEAATWVLLSSGSSSHEVDCFSDKILLPVLAISCQTIQITSVIVNIDKVN